MLEIFKRSSILTYPIVSNSDPHVLPRGKRTIRADEEDYEIELFDRKLANHTAKVFSVYSKYNSSFGFFVVMVPISNHSYGLKEAC